MFRKSYATCEFTTWIDFNNVLHTPKYGQFWKYECFDWNEMNGFYFKSLLELPSFPKATNSKDMCEELE